MEREGFGAANPEGVTKESLANFDESSLSIEIGEVFYYCCPVKLKIAQNLSPNSFIIKDSDFFMIKASPPN